MAVLKAAPPVLDSKDRQKKAKEIGRGGGHQEQERQAGKGGDASMSESD